jgi:hypothetical protein
MNVLIPKIVIVIDDTSFYTQMVVVALDVSSDEVRTHVSKKDSFAWYGLVAFDVGDLDDRGLHAFERVLTQIGCRVVDVVVTPDTFVYAMIPMIGRTHCSIFVGTNGKAYMPKTTLTSVKYVLDCLNTLKIEYDSYITPYAEDVKMLWKLLVEDD